MSKWSELPESRRRSLSKSANTYVKKNYDRIHFNMPVGTRSRWLEEAHKRGYEALAPFIRDCVENYIKFSDNSDNSVDSNSLR